MISININTRLILAEHTAHGTRERRLSGPAAPLCTAGTGTGAHHTHTARHLASHPANTV